jgi:nucleoside-diphosphate-sugar epimerase
MKTIAISGGGGYIGSRTIGYFLNKGYKVRTMDNFYKGHCDALFPYTTNENFEFIYGDVTNINDCNKLVQGADAVVNLAAIVGFPQCARNKDLAYAVNVRGTSNMMEARNHFNKDIPFIFTSTGSVYGAVTEQLCTEKTPTNTNTVYGLTKLAAENRIIEEENAIVYRYATAFGTSPCMRVQLLVNDFVFRAFNEKIIVVFEADFKRTFIHISDFIRSLEFAILNYKNMKDKVYNVGDNGLNWSKRELAEYISKKTGCALHFAETGKDLDVRNYEVDYSKINNLGFKCEMTMESGIQELIRAIPLLRVGNRYEPN